MGGAIEEQRHVLVLGRACLDLYSNDVGTPLGDARSFNVYVGGSPANIAVGLARLGSHVRFVSRVGADETGVLVRRRLESFGIDTSMVRNENGARTGIVLGAFRSPDEPDLVFYRDRAADLMLRETDIDPTAVIESALVVTTGTGLAGEPSRQATLRTLSLASEGGVRTAFVVDHRAPAWAGAHDDDVRAQYERAIRYSDVVVGTADEITLASGVSDWKSGARRIADLGPSVVVRTLGASGASLLEGGAFASVPAAPCSPVNPVGAGDAFAGSFFLGLLEGLSPRESVELGAAAGSIVAERHGCSVAMPNREELNSRLVPHQEEGFRVSADGLLERFKSGTLIDDPSEAMKGFLDHAPDGVAEEFLSLLLKLNETQALDYKTKTLLRVCASMIVDHERGVRSWGRAALRAGANKNEIIEAMYTLIPQVGAIPVVRMLPEILALEPE